MKSSRIAVLFTTLVVLLLTTPVNAGNEVFLTGGTLAGQQLSDSEWTITVEPGQSISGNVLAQVYNAHGSNAVVPFGYTWTWGARETAIVTVRSNIGRGISNWNVPIDLSAPLDPGTYYILFGHRGEFTLKQVFSATNWTVGSGTWYDDNDYHDMTEQDLLFAHNNGCVANWTYLFTDGYRHPYSVAVMPIKVNVLSPFLEVVDISVATWYPFQSLNLHFNKPIDSNSFSLEEDVISLAGPVEGIVIGHFWLDNQMLELQTLLPQYGEYELILGPNITSLDGDLMDTDRDGIGGEPLEDRSILSVTVAPPWITSHHVGLEPLVDSVIVNFDRIMRADSFDATADIALFEGHEGPVTVDGWEWVDLKTLDLMVNLTRAGSYSLVMEPNIFDLGYTPLDQDGDLNPGELGDDNYTIDFTITAPIIVSATPPTVPPVEAVILHFNRPMAADGFSVEQDIIGFTGPSGSLNVTGFEWLDRQTLELLLEDGGTGTYELRLFSTIPDTYGNNLDLDQDGILGEAEDNYTLSFATAAHGPIPHDSTWNGLILIDGDIQVPSGVTLTIAEGTIVKFTNSSAGITVQNGGKLVCAGSVDNHVVLTSYRDDSHGGDTNSDGDATTASYNDWRGLQVQSHGEAQMAAAEILYASKAIDADYQYAKVSLSRSILENGGFGIYVYSPYAEVIAENCLIANNSYTGVFVRASSAHVLRNCTIVGNGFSGSGWHGTGIHVGASTIEIDNTIVAFNRTGLDHSGDPPQIIVRNSIFHNPSGSEIAWDGDPGRPDLSLNGNKVIDPEFINYSTSNYELNAGSPAIDAGLGFLSTSLDILGHGRYDDPGVLNTGGGYPTYLDIGAYERQIPTINGDLVVTQVYVLNPVFVSGGDPYTVEWTVTNVGLEDVNGPWDDVLYLSRDAYISSDDTVLEVRADVNGLVAGDSYTKVYNGVAPSDISGPMYVLVQTKNIQSFVDPVQANNLLASQTPLGINVPELSIGSMVNSSVPTGQWQYFKLEAEIGNTIVLSLTSAGNLQLYTSLIIPPTMSDYDLIADETGRLRILDPEAGTYYVGLYAPPQAGGPVNFTLAAELADLGIRSVSPSVVGNTGTVTLEIIGDAFDPDAQAELIAPGETTVIEAEEHWKDVSTLFATFDLTTAVVDPCGYDLRVTNSDSSQTTLFEAVLVEPGEEPDFWADLQMQGRTRPGRIITLRIEYGNATNINIPSPIVTLDAGNKEFCWQLPGSQSWVTDTDIRFLALSTEGPVTALRPGQTETIEIKARTPLQPGRFNIAVRSMGATPFDGSQNPIDWEQFEADVRPSSMTDEDWLSALANLQTQVGPTWGDYANAIRENAQRWMNAGRFVYPVRKLFAMELDKAMGLPTNIVSGSIIDMYSAEPLQNTQIGLWDPNSGAYEQTTTGANGDFYFYGVDTGTYNVEISRHITHFPEQLEIFSYEDLYDTQVIVTEAAHITGNVYDANEGHLLVDAFVFATDSNSGFSAGTVTDEYGHFELLELNEGSYVLTASSEGYITRTVNDIDISLSTWTEQNLGLTFGATITGVVIDSNDATPLEDAVVFTHGQENGTITTAKTDANGIYILTSLPTDTYTIEVSASGYVGQRISDVAIVAVNSYPDFDFSLEEGGRLTGHVRNSADNQPLEGAEVMLEIADGNAITAITDISGDYLLEGIPGGTWNLTCDHPRYLPSDGVVVSITQGLTTVKDIILDTGVSIFGHVIDASTGDDVIDASIFICANDVPVGYAESDLNGLATIEGLAHRTYTAVVDYPRRARTWYGPLEVTGGTEEFSISLQAESSIIGLITLDGNLLHTVNVLAVLDSNLPLSVFTADTYNGTFVLSGLPAGTYYLQIFNEDIITRIDDIVLSSEEELDIGTIALDSSLGGLAPAHEGALATDKRQSMVAGFSLSLPCPSFLGKYCKLVQNVERLPNDPHDYDLPLWPVDCYSDCSFLYWKAYEHRNFIDDRFEHWDTTRRSLRGVVFRDGTIVLLHGVSTACDIALGVYGDILKKANIILLDPSLAKYADLIEATHDITSHGTKVGALLKDLILCLQANCDTSELFWDLTEELIFLADAAMKIEKLEHLAPGPIGTLISVARHIYSISTGIKDIAQNLDRLWQQDESARIDYENQVMRTIAAIHKYQNCLRDCQTDGDDDGDDDGDGDGDGDGDDDGDGDGGSDDPDNPGEDEDDEGGSNDTSYTPEDKYGPSGYDPCDVAEGAEQRYLGPDETLRYRIEFWNKEDANVPTQDAVIVDALDPNIFDLDTLNFTRIGFLRWDVALPCGQVIDTRIDCRPYMDIAVDVTTTFDPNTGYIRWWFHCIDPLTGEYPEDPMAGFLPPFNPDTGYEIGWVEFTVDLLPGLPNNTVIENQAFVEFDDPYEIDPCDTLADHPAPKEGPWLNTLDVDLPSSHVIELSRSVFYNQFPVRWTGSDATSGVACYDIYVIEDGGPWVLWLHGTTKTSEWFTGENGHTYAFYSVAVDNVGNIEEGPFTADTSTTVAGGFALDLGDDPFISEGQEFNRWISVEGMTVAWSGRVDYGDGSGIQNLVLSEGGFSLIHTYTDDGSYTLTVEITNQYGTTIAKQLGITILVVSNNLHIRLIPVSVLRVSRFEFDHTYQIEIINNSQQDWYNLNMLVSSNANNIGIVDGTINGITVFSGDTVTSEDTIVLRLDRSAPLSIESLDWSITQNFDSEVIATGLFTIGIAGDYDGSGKVDMLDFCDFADAWLQNSTGYDLSGDGFVNLKDLSLFSGSWNK